MYISVGEEAAASSNISQFFNISASLTIAQDTCGCLGQSLLIRDLVTHDKKIVFYCEVNMKSLAYFKELK
jgi:hypothetical protein